MASTVVAVRDRRRTLVVLMTVLVLALAAAGCALAAPRAWADAAPIPGSPLDAYDHHEPYDTGVHRIARLAALVAYALMVATMVLGVMLRLRFLQRSVNRATFYGAHMTLALSAMIFGGIHGLTFVYQPVWRIGWPQLAVPFLGGTQRVPVGLGIVGTELAVAVACAVWLQRRLGYHRWLRVHQFAYVSFALVWLHVFLVHPEPRHPDLVAVGVAAGAGTILLAFLIRLFPSRSRLRQRAFPGTTGVAE
ncbi:ferric reductase-like transmembrane domain-containing protein [Actinacidiphila acidipaludis]|uniref:Ferric reductase-like transmembrane domain-containing protein n=1 Tax=Actinacidiphila acidipaludis TaxID=2873382 RepID=A0ABS7QIQ0_9ACTN|nr:ferric reductase-like transmembrane domain-containing protein [Streptomyces acidipaludis]MBY8881792.1 ferric reductase-like transmembrane domain-containing protein [Streptomyces acidipaludis]